MRLQMVKKELSDQDPEIKLSSYPTLDLPVSAVYDEAEVEMDFVTVSKPIVWFNQELKSK